MKLANWQVTFGTALLMSACWSKTTVYRDTWQPVDVDGEHGYARVLTVALLLPSNDDIEIARAAGAKLIGWHEARKGWSLRAGSTGGTHFFPIAEQTSNSSTTACGMWSGVMLCSSSGPQTRWSRIAVLRIPAANWHLLPPHLIPPSTDVLDEVDASARRTGCEVHRSTGKVSCRNDWGIERTHAPEALQPATTPVPPPQPPEPAAPEPQEPAEPQAAPSSVLL